MTVLYCAVIKSVVMGWWMFVSLSGSYTITSVARHMHDNGPFYICERCFSIKATIPKSRQKKGGKSEPRYEHRLSALEGPAD